MNIAILGYGVVGKGVELIAKENNINVSYILMRETDTLIKTNMTKYLDDILKATDIQCVVECIGGEEPSFSYIKKCMESGKNVISSNKKCIVNHYRELIQIAKDNNVKFLFSSACGGAIPWLSELNKIANSDELYEFRGIMNGTSNYILNKMYNENLSFDSSLIQAQALGYAEKDPSDDIDGIDTLNKTILSMGVGFKKYVKLENVFVRGIRNINIQDLKYIKDNKYKCVLLGYGNKETLNVMPRFIKDNNIFYNIKDNYNCFNLQAKNFGSFFMIGQGAGSCPTASNVIRDIKMFDSPYKVELLEELIPDYDKDKYIFYIRTKNKLDDNIVDKKIYDDTYITKKISINELKKIINDDDFIGEIIDD